MFRGPADAMRTESRLRAAWSLPDSRRGEPPSRSRCRRRSSRVRLRAADRAGCRSKPPAASRRRLATAGRAATFDVTRAGRRSSSTIAPHESPTAARTARAGTPLQPPRRDRRHRLSAEPRRRVADLGRAAELDCAVRAATPPQAVAQPADELIIDMADFAACAGRRRAEAPAVRARAGRRWMTSRSTSPTVATPSRASRWPTMRARGRRDRRSRRAGQGDRRRCASASRSTTSTSTRPTNGRAGWPPKSAEWALELNQRVPDSTVGLAHALAGSSATVGFHALSDIARALEGALQHTQALAYGTPQHGTAFTEAAEEIRRLLHQFAAGFLKEPEHRRHRCTAGAEGARRFRSARTCPRTSRSATSPASSRCRAGRAGCRAAGAAAACAGPRRSRSPCRASARHAGVPAARRSAARSPTSATTRTTSTSSTRSTPTCSRSSRKRRPN